jgi:hypothetical protein
VTGLAPLAGCTDARTDGGTPTDGAVEAPASGTPTAGRTSAPIDFTAPHEAVPNAAWTWYTDERAIVDDEQSRILVGSVSSGGEHDGDIVVTWHDIDDGDGGSAILHEGLEADDHDNAALYQRSDGRYVAMYSTHGEDALKRWRVSSEPYDPSSWDPEQTLNMGHPTTYSNIYHLPEDDGGAGRTYSFVRAQNWDPNVLISGDEGLTWAYGGRLLQRGGNSDRPYVKYTTDGEAIHFIATEEHPRRFQNSIYHGYVRDGTLYDSTGTVRNENVLDDDASAPGPTDLTTVFESGTTVQGEAMVRAWTIDIAVDEAGNPVALFVVRANDDPEDHRFFYARWTGSEWDAHHLAKAGHSVFLPSEQDYTGLGSIDPNDTARMVVSTPLHPETDAELSNYELFLGETSDGGASWDWTALTPDAEQWNIRPLLPEWNDERTALVWMRGAYRTFTDWDTQAVGVADTIRPVETDAFQTPAVETVAPADYIEPPFGANLGGEPENPQSALPVTIDGLTFETLTDPRGHDAIDGSSVQVGSGTDQAIAGTDHDALYQTSVFGTDVELNLFVTAGTYDVTLHFAEVFFSEAGKRVFDVVVQGETVRERLDVVDAVGDHTALTVTVAAVAVRDDPLTVRLPTHANQSLLRGIDIR